jgi:cysteine desulfurase family protein
MIALLHQAAPAKTGISTMNETIYLDNAATSYPKPDSVCGAVGDALKNLGSAGRGAHRLSLQASRLVFETRTAVGEFLGAPAERIIFTPGCTYSINTVLKGVSWAEGDNVLVSSMEHNAVMRPLHQLKLQKGINVNILPYSPGEIVSPRALADQLRSTSVKLCVLTEGSNVTGEILNLEACADLCARSGVPLLVDAAQTAGRKKNTLQHEGIAFWAASAHKGLYGPSGIGLLYVNPRFDLEPLVAGGTGSASEQMTVPSAYPDRLEPGTMPVHAIAGLQAGLEFVLSTGIDRILEHEDQLSRRFLRWCSEHPALIRTFGAHSAHDRLPVVSFQLKEMTCDRVADILDTEYGICVRSGLHCSALAHTTIGTIDQGTVRASFGYFTTVDDIDELCEALSQFARSTAKPTTSAG